MKNENKEVKQKKEKSVIPGTNVSKVGVIVTSVILAVLIAISTFFVVVFSAQPYELKDGQLDVYKLTSTIYTKMIVAAMPDSIHDDDTGIDFYIEVNDNYDYHYDSPIEQYSVYYYNKDKDNEKTYLFDGVYEDNTYNLNNKNAKNVLIGFFISGMNSIKKIKTVVIIILVILIIAILALLIALITMLVKVKHDRELSQYNVKKKLQNEQSEKENK